MHASFFLFLFLSFFLLLSTLSLFHNLRLKLREMKASMAMSELPNPASTTPVNKSARQSRRKKKRTDGRKKFSARADKTRPGSRLTDLQKQISYCIIGTLMKHTPALFSFAQPTSLSFSLKMM